MEYRFLCNTGMKVSVLSYGNWFTSNVEGYQQISDAIVKRCWEQGVNFFDCAEIYGKVIGEGEIILGNSLKQLQAEREDLVISTKIWGKKENGVNRHGLSRKHIFEATNKALQRLQVEYIDLLYCHRFDQETPLEETVRAMNQLIDSGKIFYWGTSEWTAQQIQEAFAICDRLGLVRPVIDQAQYSMLYRDKVEVEFLRLFDEFKYGVCAWSPLAGGILTGKYRKGVEEGTRFASARAQFDRIYVKFYSAENKGKTNKMLDQLEEIAQSLGGTLPQLALAWVLANKNVPSAVFGASRVEQVDDNIGAVNVYRQLTPELLTKIEDILQTRPTPAMNWKTWSLFPPRR